MSLNPLERSSKQLAHSAGRLQQATGHIEDSADRRTQLAADRTVFAAERTYAAWVRTGFVALASGVGATKLLEGLAPNWVILGNASVLVLFSAFCFAAGVWRHLYPGPPPPKPDTARISPWILVGVNGFLAFVSLTVLIGIWFGRNG